MPGLTWVYWSTPLALTLKPSAFKPLSTIQHTYTLTVVPVVPHDFILTASGSPQTLRLDAKGVFCQHTGKRSRRRILSPPDSRTSFGPPFLLAMLGLTSIRAR